MGTTFVIMTTLKLATMGGLGIGLASAMQFFHNYDFKLKKGKKGSEDNDHGNILREKSRHIS
jgi:hypothetical protein